MEKNTVLKMFSFRALSESKFILFRQLVGSVLGFIFLNFILANDNLFWGNHSLYFFHALGLFCALAFSLNFFRKIAAILILGLLAYSIFLSPFSMRVIPGYLGFYLIYTLFIPSNEGRWVAKNTSWVADHSLHVTFILIIAFSFTYSGITKLNNPNWIDGTALSLMKDNPRFYFPFEILRNDSLLKIATWGILLLELLFFPFYLLKEPGNGPHIF